MIIVQVGSRPVGLLADRVLDIVSFEPTQVQPVPRIAQASRVDFLSGLVTVDGAYRFDRPQQPADRHAVRERRRVRYRQKIAENVTATGLPIIA